MYIGAAGDNGDAAGEGVYTGDSGDAGCGPPVASQPTGDAAGEGEYSTGEPQGGVRGPERGVGGFGSSGVSSCNIVTV